MEEDNGEIERARIMELAQQQQMALQRLDAIIVNRNNGMEMRREQQLQEEQEQGGDDVVPPQQEEEEEQLPPLIPPQNNRRRRHNRIIRGWHANCSISQIYFILSALLAFLAVITSPSNVLFASIRVSLRPTAPDSLETSSIKEASQLQQSVSMDGYGNIISRMLNSKGEGGWEAVVAHSKAKHSPPSGEPSTEKGESNTHSSASSWTGMLMDFVEELRVHFNHQYYVLQEMKFQVSLLTHDPTPDVSHTAEAKQPRLPSRWLPLWGKQDRADSIDNADDSSNKQSSSTNQGSKTNSWRHHHGNNFGNIKLHSILSSLLRVVDPSLIPPFLSTKQGGVTTDASQAPLPEEARSVFLAIIDKIFASTPRLIAVANLLLAVTYLLQTAVADVFLGPVNVSSNNRRNNTTGPSPINVLNDQARRRRRAGRERFGGFLLFKLLLISAVLEPDSVDLFILLLWFTLLSFLRSLAHLAGATATHASQSGEPPSRGALRLLVLVFLCDAAAATGCVAVFHPTGINMVLLLTSDCILLAVDTIAHIVRHVGATLEERHRMNISQLEERQMGIRSRWREQVRGLSNDSLDNARGMETEADSGEDNSLALEETVRQIDRAVEIGEARHSQRMATMDTAVFLLELTLLILTVAHFLHIWALHGTGFGLTDGVLALHLHSTISLISRKIAERRSAHRISREINSTFPDASDLDIRKAAAAGEVCCICLNSMMVGGVKKVGCDHIFHTHCLREVVERERSISLAKCPLCRASLVTGRHDTEPVRPAAGVGFGNNRAEINIANANAGPVGPDDTRAQPGQLLGNPLNPGEQSLLRFSTENIFPAWLPVPAFAFEVVRRETTTMVEPNPNPEGGGWQRFFRRGGEVQIMAAADNGDNEQVQPQEEQQPQREASFWRRLLILVGAIPMSPEEEATALEQLVEMFPQYDRADLLRELRARRSAEAVAESILLGLFSGIPRGGGLDVE